MEVDQQKNAAEEEEKADKTLEVYIYATDTCIKVLGNPASDLTGAEGIGSKVYSELKPSREGVRFTLFRLSGDTMIVAEQGGLIKCHKLALSEDG